MTKEELIKNLSELIAGLEVPYSIDKRILGTAGEAWHKIYGGLNLFGYASSTEIENQLIKLLKKEESQNE